MFNQATSMDNVSMSQCAGTPQIISDFSGWKFKHFKHVFLRIHCFRLMNWVKLWRAVIHIVMKLQSESNATSPLCWYVRGHPFTKTFQLLQYSSSIIILKGYLPFSGKTFGLSIQGWLLVKYSLQWFSNSFYSMVESICLLPWLPIQLRNICVSEYLAHFCPILQEFRV